MPRFSARLNMNIMSCLYSSTEPTYWLSPGKAVIYGIGGVHIALSLAIVVTFVLMNGPSLDALTNIISFTK